MHFVIVLSLDGIPMEINNFLWQPQKTLKGPLGVLLPDLTLKTHHNINII